ncbi:MAG: tyrosine-type recombinase/integrase [Candidatus Thiodiazotropha endolucinida]|nr:tyrosine-type recombinase/integrase [Candidatus Thiodiazotropha taylori]MCW4260819.1 tyrosine-type recombinase/integrase [Candidatus Thiodiazotropha endolucinida]
MNKFQVAGLFCVCRHSDSTCIQNIIHISGVGLRETIRGRLTDSGATAADNDGLAERMASYVISSKADNTNKKYFANFNRFKAFCVSKGFPYKPADPIHVAIYLTHLLDSHASFHVISAAFYSIKWVHEINCFSDPTSNGWVKSLLEAGKRLNSNPIKKKDTVDSEMLISLCDKFRDTSDVLYLRDITMILLGYAGFLRFSEISQLKCNDIEFKEDYFILYIRKSKTDVYRDGKEVLISKGVSSACPHSMLLRYLDASGQDNTLDMYLFRPVNRYKGRAKLLAANKQLSYTRARECIVEKLRLVAPTLNLGTHSLRASGATMVANAEGHDNINERCLLRHGRWKSSMSKDGYVKDSVEKRLSVTKKLKL